MNISNKFGHMILLVCWHNLIIKILAYDFYYFASFFCLFVLSLLEGNKTNWCINHTDLLE